MHWRILCILHQFFRLLSATKLKKIVSRKVIGSRLDAGQRTMAKIDSKHFNQIRLLLRYFYRATKPQIQLSSSINGQRHKKKTELAQCRSAARLKWRFNFIWFVNWACVWTVLAIQIADEHQCVGRWKFLSKHFRQIQFLSLNFSARHELKFETKRDERKNSIASSLVWHMESRTGFWHGNWMLIMKSTL